MTSWSPVPETDTASYLVYRQKPGRHPRLAGQVPAAQKSFLDTVVPAPGAQRLYSVVAVDTAGNESESSLPVRLQWP